MQQELQAGEEEREERASLLGQVGSLGLQPATWIEADQMLFYWKEVSLFRTTTSLVGYH